MPNDDFSTPASSDDEAEERYQKFKSNDPFPDIQPALLNSADFIDYAVTTGMIYPFDTEKGIKSASYEVKLGGEVLYWDDKDERQYKPNLENEETIVFKRNSITFVTVSARFRLPDYIALRFNLQIHHVHRGLLLGTGPLVDPGFNGTLMIPIHNLTENDYIVDKNEGLICVEFTKLSENDAWNNESSNYTRAGEYKSNPGKKNNKSFLNYVDMHVPQGKVRSTLSATLADARKELDAARKELGKVKTAFNVLSIGGAIGVVVLIFSTYSLISDANKYVADAKNTYLDELNNTPNRILLDVNKEEMAKVYDTLNDYEVLQGANKKQLQSIQDQLRSLNAKLGSIYIKIDENIEKKMNELNRSAKKTEDGH